MGRTVSTIAIGISTGMEEAEEARQEEDTRLADGSKLRVIATIWEG
jgi:hypothetical protein